MRNQRLVRLAAVIVAVLLTSPLKASAAQGSALAALRARFEAGQRPEAADLCGTWALVTNVSTAQFLTGGDGPERVLADSLGIRRDLGTHTVDEWRLVIERDSGEVLRATSASAWEPTGDTSGISVGADAITFGKDYGGDSQWVYRCRMESGDLICLLVGHEAGHGVAFRRIGPANPRPRPTVAE